MNIKNDAHHNDSAARGSSSPCRRLWDLVLPGCLAVVSTLFLTTNGKADPPWRKTAQQTSSPPTVPQTLEPGTVSVDQTRPSDPHDFRPEATRDQKIHVHIDLGRVFETRGNFEAALMEYQQALEACGHKSFGRLRSTDEALAERRIAGALDRLGRFSQAEVHYKKAIRLSPRDSKIWNDTGYSYYLQGRWADAERTFRTALRYAPDDPRITTNLGLTLAAAGRTRDALPLLSRFTGDAVGHANLGFLLAATGQVDLAREQYLQALALSPSLPLARRALAQLDRARDVESVAAVAAGTQQPADQSVPHSPSSDSEVRRTAGSRPHIPPPRHFVVSPPPLPALPPSR
jgi:tetratricopeptide (TPR) repeat protein